MCYLSKGKPCLNQWMDSLAQATLWFSAQMNGQGEPTRGRADYWDSAPIYSGKKSLHDEPYGYNGELIVQKNGVNVCK